MSAATAQEALVADIQTTTETGQVGDDIIITGTRAESVTAAESTAPIKVLGAELLSHVGQPNLNQVLTQLVPSFTAQAFGGDTPISPFRHGCFAMRSIAAR